MSLPPLIRALQPTTGTRAASLRKRLHAAVVTLSFWCAIILPFLYLPLLVIGLGTTTQLGVFGGLLLLNIIALLITQTYQPAE